MQKLLFVCLGNICRSPLAEGIMLHLKANKELKIEVDSAGTAGYHIGESPDHRTQANAKKNGVDLSQLRARQFTMADFKKFDHILAMDRTNFNNLIKLAGNSEDKEKVKLFLEFASNQTTLEVPDPYYGNEADFEQVFQLVYKACEQLCKKLSNEK